MTDPQSPGSDSMLAEVFSVDHPNRDLVLEALGFPPRTSNAVLWRALGKRFLRLHLVFELRLESDRQFQQRIRALVEKLDFPRPG